MLHQKVVIYIILSAILLYLYYKRCDLAIFASFIVVVLGTLIIRKDFDSVEGMKGKGGGECAKMGFTEPKIVKDKNNDVGESLEKEMKKIKKIADKYWPYDEKGDSNDETEKTSMAEYIKVYAKITKKTTFSKEEDEAVKMFMEVSKSLYYKVNNPDESKREKIESKLSDLPKGYIKKYFIPTKLSSLLEKISKSSELKDQGAKKLAKYLTCLCNHWIAIWTKIDSMATGKKWIVQIMKTAKTTTKKRNRKINRKKLLKKRRSRKTTRVATKVMTNAIKVGVFKYLNNIKTFARRTMMNQKVIIYIILSAILLYLYYKRGGVILFAAFIVVAAGTLFTGTREGLSRGGKGGGGDKECAKLGFSAPKIEKNKMEDGIKKSMKNIQKVANKYWQFEDYIGNTPTSDKAKENLSAVTGNSTYKSESRKIEKDKVIQENVATFLTYSVGLYEAFKKDEKIEETITQMTEKLENGIKGGNEYLSILKKNHKFLKDEYKVAGVEDKGDLKLSQYLLCLCEQWLSIWKQIQKANGGSEGGDNNDAGDDEEDKPKKKKKKATKKKSKKDDEGGDEGDD